MNFGSSGIRFQRFGSIVPGGAWWLLMIPGILLIGLAFSILIWPDLLAYIVAFTILFVGTTLIGWSLALRRAAKIAQKQRDVSPNYADVGSARQVIYYD